MDKQAYYKIFTSNPRAQFYITDQEINKYNCLMAVYERRFPQQDQHKLWILLEKDGELFTVFTTKGKKGLDLIFSEALIFKPCPRNEVLHTTHFIEVISNRDTQTIRDVQKWITEVLKRNGL